MASMKNCDWNKETKTKLSINVTSLLDDFGSLSTQVMKSSKANEQLERQAKNFAALENTIESSSTTLKKVALLISHMQFQAESIERSYIQASTVNCQLDKLMNTK